ncbi:site-specific DNA-methyltransferase [Deinococcus aerophilus]|uniref:DNA methylase N-4/N-6 domain-containing protein n=1 Tax=Deinococcus aerophilus TaxID=522488 RepID=A0ABQ2GPE3_9DEIO|nr:site-specific DNA-methyltransferase [Deinococcus aerophilus]GGM06673.1 hypothetical protein GCM10010841_13650 [Deinococcus aerophilus]
MIEELKRPDRLDEDRIEAIKALFPEAFPDGRFNPQALKELLEDPNEAVGQDADFYGLSWPGKKQARKRAASAPTVTLAPKPGEGENEQSTRNVIIEGDNLEVMQALLRAYAGKVKLIYIDPPYNTGNDFVYRDDFKSSTEAYLEETGQRDVEGLLVSNPRTGGRFHANWLNMIYPRLKMAHSLLMDDGLIFISIDDNELNNLRLVCGEVFGDENFIGNIVWQKKYAPANDTVNLSYMHEYIMVYAKQKKYSDAGRQIALISKMARSEAQNALYKNPDGDPRGDWASDNYTCNKTAEERPNLFYPIIQPKTGKEIWPSRSRVWAYSQIEHQKHIEEGRLWWGINKENETPRYKRYLSDVGGVVSDTWWSHDKVGHSDEAKKEFKALFSEATDAFDTPKPTRMIKRIVELATTGVDGHIVLDFFAGSGTTGQAVMEVNDADDGDRRFILVQAPEASKPGSEAMKAGLSTISKVTAERVRRAAKKIKAESKADRGFRVYQTTPSNLRKYRPITVQNVAELGGLDFKGSGALVPDFNSQNVITEMMLLEGFPLDSRIEQAPEFSDQVYVVSHPERSHRLLISLTADKLLDETVEQASQYPKDTFICLESSLTDQSKIRLADAVAKVKTL